MDYRDGLAGAMNGLVVIFVQTGRNTEAIDMCRQVLPIRRRLVEDFPSVPLQRGELAKCLGNLAVSLIRSRQRLNEAETSIRESTAIFEAIVRDYPDLPESRLHLALGLDFLTVFLDRPDRRVEAAAVTQKAMDTVEPLVARTSRGSRVRQIGSRTQPLDEPRPW